MLDGYTTLVSGVLLGMSEASGIKRFVGSLVEVKGT
jgi:hypothetical protein